MAEMTFTISTGPYAGDYSIDAEDFTATESGLFRQAVGFPLEVVAERGVGLDVIAGLVWLTRRRAPKSKGLAYAAVADSFTSRALEFAEADSDDEDAAPAEDEPIPPEG